MKNPRRFMILKAIVESFIESAEPVGSKFLLEHYKMDVSSATIRNEMAVLEELGLLYQPFTSAGRVPTDLGFRLFVDELMDTIPAVKEVKDEAVKMIKNQALEEKIYNGVSLLARTCDNVSFATLPGKNKAYYLGLANILRKPEFTEAAHAYTVVKILEDTDNFIHILSSLEIQDKVRVFIGRENIIPEIKSYSIIATKYKIPEYGEGIIGILGPMRMNYAFNIGALEYVKNSFTE